MILGWPTRKLIRCRTHRPRTKIYVSQADCLLPFRPSLLGRPPWCEKTSESRVDCSTLRNEVHPAPTVVGGVEAS